MRIRFDANLSYQQDAVNAVCDLFHGQPLAGALESIPLAASPGELFVELGVANSLDISESRLFENLTAVRKRNRLGDTDRLNGMHFSVEMETGTGKTYVYLRTLLELNARFGFKKFVLVVPNVAIREGVTKTIELTREHFYELYGRVPFEVWTYESARVSRLRGFATSNQLQLLIINIDAFNKSVNIIHRESDQLGWRKPIEFVSATKPIVIVDEPQNVESDQARMALESLAPLCTLRYSATHRNLYNLVYRLDPVRAYDLGLVKRIEVSSILEEAGFNRPYMRLVALEPSKKRVTARIELDVKGRSGVQRKTIAIIRNGVDLYELSGERDIYRGHIVDHYDAARGFLAFSNGLVLNVGESQGISSDDVMRAQIRETVTEHLEKEIAIRRAMPLNNRIKVLSLLFIDRVANYASDDGKIRRWFEETYTDLVAQERYKTLRLPSAAEVHGGYFAQVKGVVRDTSGDSEADDEAYAMIMRDKERLLDPATPLRFIFSHSALREGWDNPNVFQICTLNETRSEMKKRQEIGRGLRLPVMENGDRCFDRAINRLTVIPNESYSEFAKKLQNEIEEECAVSFEGRIVNKRQRTKMKLKKGWRADRDFLALWDQIKHKTRYSVLYDSEALTAEVIVRLKNLPDPRKSRILVQKVEIGIDRTGVSTTLMAQKQTEIERGGILPDLLSYLQRETELTRSTLARILIDSGQLGDALVDAQWFLESVVRVIRDALREFMVGGIKYERIAGSEYEMVLFEQHEIEGYLDRMVTVKKSIFETVEFDSDTEKRFAVELDSRDDILLFVKLPRWFKVETPLGTYNPDWAIVKQKDHKIYLVRETKSTLEELKLRGIEWGKVQCGKAHFEQLGVDFRVVTTAGEV